MKKYYFVFSLIFILCGCSTAYYAGMEKLGYHKRDLLETRVSAAKQSQEDAKEQFRSALETFQEVVQFEGGELQARYEQLSEQLQTSEDRATKVRSRIDSVEKVAKALFTEWEDELASYKNHSLKRASQDQLEQTRIDYDRLVKTMQRAEGRMEPVLEVFRDHVLYLKHNLNARAVSALRSEVPKIEGNVESLVSDMELAIQEAENFLKTIDS